MTKRAENLAKALALAPHEAAELIVLRAVKDELLREIKQVGADRDRAWNEVRRLRAIRNEFGEPADLAAERDALLLEVKRLQTLLASKYEPDVEAERMEARMLRIAEWADRYDSDIGGTIRDAVNGTPGWWDE